MEGLDTHENEILTRDGGRVNVAWSNVATNDVDGAVLEVTSLGIDVTERRRAEDEVRRLNAELERRVAERTAQLVAANQELEAFAYSISHDLRAPLRAIDGFSAMVLEDAGETLLAEDLEHLGRVRAGVQRMGLLIDEILALSRVTRQQINTEEVDITSCAEEILRELAEAEPARRVDTVVAPGLRARADATLLRVILVNLLSNAWKFTSKHETACIEVGGTDGGGEPAFYVRDDGAGFNAAHAARLFGVFQRMHTADEFEGEGIGLATVQRLVARHGGRVWAEAEVEKGATFYFTLPRAGGVD
jgi:light-regulated signal transduction histidine kinase (bacteriophytochrome)